MPEIDKNDFARVVAEVRDKISGARREIFQNANKSLLRLYYDIGSVINENSKWGNKFIDRLALELKLSYPGVKGFSVRNLKYMKKYYLVCSSNRFVQKASAQIPWSHNMLIIDKVLDDEQRRWYMEETYKNGWSYDMLAFQIKSDLYHRQLGVNKLNNFRRSLASSQGLLADSIMKDPYILNLTGLEEGFSELELERAMVERIKDVILELGNGFSFIGNQYRIEVDDKEYFVDLLFYHTRLHCYVAVELKNTEFKPEYAGKINFYLTAIDESVKGETDNPSIGIILCREKSRLTVEYALKKITGPVGVSSYEVSSLLPEELAKQLPGEADLNIHIRN